MMHSLKRGLHPTLIVGLASFVVVGQARAALVPRPPTPLVTAPDGLYGLHNFAAAAGGSKVFFSAVEAGPPSAGPSRLYEAPISGGAITPRTGPDQGFDGSVSWWGFSPNGADLVFTEPNGFYNGDLFALPVTAGSPRQLTSGFTVGDGPWWQPVFSGDGSRVLFLGHDGPFNPPNNLYSASLDGSLPPQPLNHPIDAARPYYLGVQGNWKLLPGGSEVMYVAPQGGGSDFHLWKSDVAGGPPERLNSTHSVYFYHTGTNSFVVDASASRVAYSGYTAPVLRPTVISRELSSGAEIDLTPGMAKHDYVQIEMHGYAQDAAIFEADFDNRSHVKLYAARPDGGAVNITATTGYRPDSAFVSPLGDAVVFTGYSGSNLGGFLFDVATSAVRPLGEFPPSSNNPSVQYNATGDHFMMSGRLYTAAGDLVRTMSGFSSWFHPDGNHVLYFDALPNAPTFQTELYMERIDGVGDAVHLSNDAMQNRHVHSYRLTSDGSTLLYSRNQFGYPSELYAVQFVPESTGMLAAMTATIGWSARRRLIWRHRN